MFTKRIVLSALLGLLLTTIGSSIATAQQSEMLREEFHQTYPLASGGRVSMENINGAVRVMAWDRSEVKVDAVKMAYRRDRLDEAKILVRSDGNSIHIETEYPHRSQTFTDGKGRENNPATVEYTLTVPRNARIDSIELINGNLDIDGIQGDVKASSINGRLTARGLTGTTNLSTINGSLEAAFDRLDASNPISLGSVNGNVVLTIPSDSNADLKAGTVHGAIRNDFGLPVRRGEYVGNDLAGQLGQGGVRIKLGNVNGGITIRHAQDGRPLSRATSLLAEKLKDKDDDDDNYYEVDRAKAEARRAAREAAREAARAQADARRAQVEAQRAQLEAQRAQLQAQREAQTEAQRARLEAQRAAREAQKEGARARLEAQEAQREALRDAERARLEGQRAALEGQREAQRARLEAQQAQREAQLDAQRAQAEAVRAAREAQRISQREAERIRLEAQRAARDAMRATTVNVDGANTLRLVERESKTFAVSGRPSITLQTFDGNITVRGWDKQEVQLTISKRAATEQQMKGIRLRTDQNGSSISVIAEFDKSFALRGPGYYSTSALVNLDLYVPRTSMLRMASGDGRLELENVNGNLDLNTGDGRIEVRDSGGSLTANTGDGRIEVANFNGAVQAHTGDGRIMLDGRFSQLAAKTGNGTIMLTVPANFNAFVETDAETVDNEGLTLTEESSSSRRLKRWKIGQGGQVLTLRTGDGRIILRRVGQ
ncbi:MAG TPA: DUF4097 family beta strand repeat-containing protein [Pyrinomonadaceae bacterium]